MNRHHFTGILASMDCLGYLFLCVAYCTNQYNLVILHSSPNHTIKLVAVFQTNNNSCLRTWTTLSISCTTAINKYPSSQNDFLPGINPGLISVIELAILLSAFSSISSLFYTTEKRLFYFLQMLSWSICAGFCLIHLLDASLFAVSCRCKQIPFSTDASIKILPSKRGQNKKKQKTFRRIIPEIQLSRHSQYYQN